ncbi:SIR2 family protein [Erwinia rhapontici]|uniref:SIR2 family protein n=1 Tax=Erwinia rhapontici TaxID=55212 RepID=UPI003BA2D41F
MCDYSLLVGNGVNNISEGYSWNDVLMSLGRKYTVDIDTQDKPFSLAYEEIYFKILKTEGNESTESDIKTFLAEKIKEITPNDIHMAITSLNCRSLMTTNYDLAFERAIMQHSDDSILSNQGLIKEQRYNIFRHHVLHEKEIWHIHGDVTVPNSITLGYEHYSGHLQNMRNYTATGCHYRKKNDFDQKPLIIRLKRKPLRTEQSWIDNFFLRDVYIIGLTLDFVEIDLWWLLNFRERNKYTLKSEINIHNQIIYYLPSVFLDVNQCASDDVKRLTVKIELLKSVGVIINTNFGKDFKSSKTHEKEFYLKVVQDIHNRHS